MDSNITPQIDSTLIKMILKSIEEGDLAVIKNYVEKYALDLKCLKDQENEQNGFFYAALIKSDEE
ncbi:MAG: hypothetical protein MJ252_17005 [archaeon]|nr:hypothetical protein [archaeon]